MLPSRSFRGVSRRGVIAAAFVALAMVLGGGGSPSPATEMVVQLGFAVALVAWLLWARLGEERQRAIPRLLLWFGLALLALPLLQLVPLPPAIWQSLPSRELQQATLSLIGEGESWRALSISPPVTLAALLALLPAVGTMWGTSLLHRRDRRFLLLAIVIVTIAGALLGALQMAGGPDDFRLYEKTHRGWLTAFHANRNAAADALLIGALALSARFQASSRDEPRRRYLPIFAAAQLILVVALILTGSRTGIALLVVSLPFHWMMLRPAGANLSRRTLFAATVAFVAALVALPLALASNSRLARVAERFDATGDARFPLWEDTLDAISGFWPAGSGVGTFPHAFQPFESLEHLDQFFPNRAHNDYLEFLLEAGLLAPAILAFGAIALFMLARRAWKLSPQDHASQLFALGTLAIVALHSIVDYPLRNMAIACLAGVAAGLLTVAPRSGNAPGRNEGREDTK
ncbi:O-antigen ligase family protein [Qipengyuania sp. 1NDH17]|uniref:O-antigen ligase family protein n=1 Tax=Qipengyuania polymorpha TaxID=2867234 RepID=A0ABS7IWL3_9SPHN|nr:O-antigen ligase family protein [Qipengyuania polymorpha]MBX7457924.1 O-antigen ligase family protein [Qipengyuania polymorpha]